MLAGFGSLLHVLSLLAAGWTTWSMRASTEANDRLEEELDEMVRDRFPEGLVPTLGGEVLHRDHADCEDAVSIGFQKLIEADRAMAHPRGYVTTVAVNSMLRILRRAALQQLADADDEGGHDELLDADVDEWTDPVVDETVASDAYDFMQGLAGAGKSRNVKTAIRLCSPPPGSASRCRERSWPSGSATCSATARRMPEARHQLSLCRPAGGRYPGATWRPGAVVERLPRPRAPRGP